MYNIQILDFVQKWELSGEGSGSGRLRADEYGLRIAELRAGHVPVRDLAGMYLQKRGWI